MTEQPPSAEAMTLLSEIIGSCGKAGMCRFQPCACAAEIDALIAQRVSAETERWQHRDRQRLEQIDRLQETVQSCQSARAERPAPIGEQSDFARCLRCVSHELTRDVCGYAGRCVRQATATSPSPAVAADYTERARELLRRIGDAHGRETQSRYYEDNKPSVKLVVDALSAVASERDAAAIRAFGQRVWSDTEEVAYQAGVSDTRARLQDSDVRKAVEAAINEQRALEAGGCFNPGDDTEGECADGDCYCTKQIAREADAALTKIAEMLK